MSEQDNIIKEYEDLRGEIKQKIELHNSLMTFMITTVVAVLAFALETDNPLMYLLPFAIIIPISMRIAYYREAIIKISSYIIVYIENQVGGLQWETRYNQLQGLKRDTIYNSLTISRYYEGIILSVICYTLYFENYIKCKIMDFHGILCLIIPFLLVVWEIVITKRIVVIDKQRNDWIIKWETFKDSSI